MGISSSFSTAQVSFKLFGDKMTTRYLDITEYFAGQALRRDRFHQFQRNDKFKVPDRKAARVRLDKMYEKPGKDVSTQMGRHEPPPRRKFGFDKIREHYDRYGFAPRYSKGPTRDIGMPETPFPAHVPHHDYYSPQDVGMKLANGTEPKGHQQETFRRHRHGRPMNPDKLHKRIMNEWTMGKKISLLKDQGCQTMKVKQARPSFMPYRSPSAEFLSSVLDDYKAQARRPLWREAPRRPLYQWNIGQKSHTIMQ